MTVAAIMITGALVFFGGFLIGNAYVPPPASEREKKNQSRAGSVILDEEYHNLMTYDGYPEE